MSIEIYSQQVCHLIYGIVRYRMNIPFNLMTEFEYKAYLFDKELNQFMSNPVEIVQNFIENPYGKLRIATLPQIIGLVQQSEEAAIFYVGNVPVVRANGDILKQCAKWRSCADMLFPALRRYMDDQVRNEIIARHSDYSIFAIKALEMNLSEQEVKELVYALVSNNDTVEQGIQYIVSHYDKSPWQFNSALAQAAYTNEDVAWQLVKDYPKMIILGGAARWLTIANKMVKAKEADSTVRRSCMRYHREIAAEYVNSNDPETLLTIFLNHPSLRDRLLRREADLQANSFSLTLKEFGKFQNRLQHSLKSKQIAG